jgi:hypothetical protein
VFLKNICGHLNENKKRQLTAPTGKRGGRRTKKFSIFKQLFVGIDR